MYIPCMVVLYLLWSFWEGCLNGQGSMFVYIGVYHSLSGTASVPWCTWDGGGGGSVLLLTLLLGKTVTFL